MEQQSYFKASTPFVIALCQEKGGVGKTTTAVCLAAGLALKGFSVLMLDLAANGNLSASFGINPNRVQRSISDLFHGTFPPVNLIKPTSITKLDLIPSDASVMTLAKELCKKKDYERLLQKILSSDDFPIYDLIVLDCSPGVTALTLNAISCANLILVPVICEYFALQSLDEMIRLFQIAQTRINHNLTYRLLVTKLDHRITLHKRVYDQIKEHYQPVVLETVIGVDVKLPESQLAGIPLLIYDPKSRASQQYKSLTDEVLPLIRTHIPEPLSEVMP